MSKVISVNPFDLLLDEQDEVVPVQKTAVKINSQKRNDRTEKVAVVGAAQSVPSSIQKPKEKRHETPKQNDRKSHANRYDGDKKEVAGKGIWGDQVQSEIVGETDIDQAVPSTPIDAQEEEEEPVQLTLQEYLKSKVNPTAPFQKARKANEGVDEKQWKNQTISHKPSIDFIVLGEEKIVKEKKVKAAAPAPAFVIQQRFNDSGRQEPSTRGARGGMRGAARGGASMREGESTREDSARGESARGGASSRGPSSSRGGRGASTRGASTRGTSSRGVSSSARTINVNDTTAFPSLSK